MVTLKIKSVLVGDDKSGEMTIITFEEIQSNNTERNSLKTGNVKLCYMRETPVVFGATCTHFQIKSTSFVW
ncbi:MAG: hypothetical protein COV07_03275 [Candidatus Vogelbacteria bacterium CG10_big_fil_rev_8_21_14_0_10_45_14]|uniref:Uncharacterized protein n=1 Tax=Candidatus Vogelbacteria bacterium CG10_big_fil_rev_8_21_14_0_10_45_14 TaxID=1975042 RepID=A0A2H0RJC2_9BACT|nr:MAG: hypothetical protein COV07_03275 [Candidatus Vogelbacteria bacterium CG10_big_fil_rev_8_21_14_0_10_45_14]